MVLLFLQDLMRHYKPSEGQGVVLGLSMKAGAGDEDDDAEEDFGEDDDEGDDEMEEEGQLA